MIADREVALDIRSIFAPVASDLERVERQLHESVQADFGPLSEVVESTIGSGGKRIRPALALLSGRMRPVDDRNLILLATAVELLHDATLIHDDLLDHSLVRRGSPTVSARWSEKATVLAGDFLLARSAKMSAQVGNYDVLQIFSDAVAVICEGEIRQDFNGNRLVFDRSEYYERIYAKTASLFAASTECAAVLNQSPKKEREALREYGRALGMAFQVVDDVLDFVGTVREVGKPVGSDLRQGLATLPTIYFHETDPRREQLVAAFSNNGHSPEDQERVIQWIRTSPAIAGARQEARDFAGQAQQALKVLKDSPYRASLWALADYVVERTK